MAAALSYLTEPERKTTIGGEYDVVVLGGGPAGIAAAATGGMHGRKVLLVERYGFLSGMGTAAGVTNFCGLHANVNGPVPLTARNGPTYHAGECMLLRQERNWRTLVAMSQFDPKRISGLSYLALVRGRMSSGSP